MPAVLSLHALDPVLSRRLSAYAKRERKSLNQSAKELLASALGIVRRKAATDHDAELAPFFGCLDDATWARAKAVQKDFERIDPEDWK